MNYLPEIKGQDGRLGVMSLIRKINDFNECYEMAESGKCEPFWEEVYKRAFPNMTNQMRGKQSTCLSQQNGVDRIIFLENNKTINIDEKVRKETWNDIALEYISNDKKNTPGWMEKELFIDYLAYAFLPIKTAYLFDWRMLKRAWVFYKESWIKKYHKVKALNKTYTTISVAVPIEDLRNACSIAAIIRLDEKVDTKKITRLKPVNQLDLF